MAIASLICGILALVIGIFGGPLSAINFPLAIAGIITGVFGRKDPEKKGMATAGLVCSIISLALGIIVTIACVACLGTLGAAGGMFDMP